MNSILRQKQLTLICFLFLPTALMLMFVAYPSLKLIQQSFTDWNGVSKSFNYIGLANYYEIFTNAPEVWISLKNNFVYMFMHLASVPVAIFIAVLLSSKIKGSQFFKLTVFLPYILNGVAVAYLFSYFFSPVGGTFNGLLELFHLESLIQGWLSDERIVNFTLAFVSVWRFTGFHIVLYVAGILSIPSDLYEAAELDGAGFLQKIRYITIPGIWTVIQITVFLHLNGTLQTFDIPFVMTNGGPAGASSTFSLYSIQMAFQYNQMGMASAMGVILLIMIIGIIFLQNKLMDRKG